MNPPSVRPERPGLPRLERSSAQRRRPFRAGASRPLPVVTYTLLAILVAVFAGMWHAGQGDVSSVATLFGDKENALIRAGQVWRLVTPIFLHGSLVHLLTNGLSLYWLGAPMETFYGSRKFLIIFLVSGVAGNLLSFALSPFPSLGASGAIFGLVGAGLIFPIRFRALVAEKARTQILGQLLVVAAINLSIGFTDRSLHVDNMAHVGGLLGGGFMALFLMPDILRRQARSRRENATLWAAVALCSLVMAASALAQWRWAARNAVPPLLTYGPSEPVPLWSVGIPQNWRLAGGQWFSPTGAAVKIADSEQDPQIVGAIAFNLARGIWRSTPTVLAGRQALRVQQRLQGHVIEIYFVPVDAHRAVTLTLAGPPTPSTPVQQDFARILGSFRLLPSRAPSMTHQAAPF
ncbi:MAG TPA: rhomboid family intramembrane serine protease [Chthonomonadaceae bacterium]|nr:rhomboid family intramembrane serine protease [Chthonomonadaceae bacterium]